MNEKELKLLIEKYLKGDVTEQERKLLLDFFDSYKGDEQAWNKDGLGSKEAFSQRMYNDIRSKIGDVSRNLNPGKTSVFKQVLKIAAVVIVVLGLGLAIHIAQNANVETKTIAWNAKSTDSGEKLTFRLSDGTVVKLNSDSKLTFPASFSDSARVVELEGEAFFDVIKDPSRPFIIRTSGIVTSVLGTSFNINAYPELNFIAVAVVTGKVKVEKVSHENAEDPVNEIYLYPARKATYIKEEHKLIESDFVSEQEIGWKQGIIYFKNASESDVIERLERWYGVDIEIENTSLREWDLTASFDNQMLDEVLLSLSHTANFNYSIQNKKIIINYIKSE